jgi:hypothetical protein
VGLFGNNEQRSAKEAAGAAELARLEGLSIDRLAAELIPGFGPGGVKRKGGQSLGALQLIQWLMRDFPYHPSLRALVEAVLAALEKLAGAGLLIRRASGVGSGAQSFKLSPLGVETLAAGTVEQQLKSG